MNTNIIDLKISSEYEYEYHYSVSTIRILFEYRIIRSPLPLCRMHNLGQWKAKLRRSSTNGRASPLSKCSCIGTVGNTHTIIQQIIPNWTSVHFMPRVHFMPPVVASGICTFCSHSGWSLACWDIVIGSSESQVRGISFKALLIFPR